MASFQSRMLNLTPLGKDTYRGHDLLLGDRTRKVVYGGHILTQASLAACHTVPDSFVLRSLHGYFLRPVKGDESGVQYTAVRLKDGASVCTRSVQVHQHGSLMAYWMMSFHEEEPNTVSHQDTMPRVPDPEILLNGTQLLQLFENEHGDGLSEPRRESLNTAYGIEDWYHMEVRPCDPELYLYDYNIEGVAAQAPKRLYWIKPKSMSGFHHKQLCRLLVIYLSDWNLHSVVRYPFLDTLRLTFLTSLDHSVWIHEDFSLDEWLLLDVEMQRLENGRIVTQARFWTKHGNLVANVVQEGLIRGKMTHKL